MIEQREKLIELIRYAPKVKLPFGGRANGKEYQTAGSIADHLLSDEEIKHAFELLKAEKEGRLIAPPCKVGDIFYQPIKWDGSIDECKVSSLTMKADGSYKIRLTSGRYRCVQEMTPEYIGKTVFLSREAAEKALKERKDK